MEEYTDIYRPRFFYRPIIILASVALFSLFIFYRLTLAPPPNFPINRYVEIKKGFSIQEAGIVLKEKSIIRSSSMFRLYIYLFGVTDNIIAGEYRFDKPEKLYTVVKQVTDTGYRGRAVRVTIPEGLANKEMVKIFETRLPNFDSDSFLRSASRVEGFLFPDTYIFPVVYDEGDVIGAMRDNFQKRTAELADLIKDSKRTERQVIIMASILEKEARTTATRKTVAGILWKRLDTGMPLQVDASFLYLLNKPSSELTVDDLNMDSPYNTYKYKGLPPGPISNPGLDSILSALEPVSSPYLFYLTDNNGKMHYARNFEEHKQNKRLYLK